MQLKNNFAIGWRWSQKELVKKEGVICWNTVAYIYARCLDYFCIQLAETALLRCDSAD